jgi:hypothetical protein
LIDENIDDPVLEKVSLSHPYVKELMSYYQGADYVLKNRLNRWSGDKIDFAVNLGLHKN